jgi:hypothetical protein
MFRFIRFLDSRRRRSFPCPISDLQTEYRINKPERGLCIRNAFFSGLRERDDMSEIERKSTRNRFSNIRAYSNDSRSLRSSLSLVKCRCISSRNTLAAIMRSHTKKNIFRYEISYSARTFCAMRRKFSFRPERTSHRARNAVKFASKMEIISKKQKRPNDRRASQRATEDIHASTS